MALLQNKQCHATVMVKTALKTQWLKEGSFAAAATAAIVLGGYFFFIVCSYYMSKDNCIVVILRFRLMEIFSPYDISISS